MAAYLVLRYGTQGDVCESPNLTTCFIELMQPGTSLNDFEMAKRVALDPDFQVDYDFQEFDTIGGCYGSAALLSDWIWAPWRRRTVRARWRSRTQG